MLKNNIEKDVLKSIERFIDIIFSHFWLCRDLSNRRYYLHSSKPTQSLVIQRATQSPYSHMGMIVVKNSQTMRFIVQSGFVKRIKKL